MYERFTDRSRKVLQLANMAAHEFGQESVSTEHVLIGLIKEGSGVAAHVLKNLGCDLEKIKQSALELTQHSEATEPAKTYRLPHTPRTGRVIEYSIEAAKKLNHNYVGTEHILLGLCREHEGVASQVLMKHGITDVMIEQNVLNLLGVNNVCVEYSKLQEELEKAVADQDLERSKRLTKQIKTLTSKMKKEQKQKSAKTLRIMASMILAHFAEDSDPTKTLSEIRDLL